MKRKSGKLSGVSRRSFLTNAFGASSAVALLSPASKPSYAQDDTPRRGGTLRIGMTGGTSADSWDPALVNYPVPAMCTKLAFQCLVELDRQGRAVPELAESWEVDATGLKWVFNLRKGAEFHDGKTLNSEDVAYSLRRHIGPKSISIAKSMVHDVVDVATDGSHRVIVTLSRRCPDLAEILAYSAFGIAKHDFMDWQNPVGTGPYAVQAFQPGVNVSTKRHANFWKTDCAWYDAVDVIVINDSTARVNALLTGRIDVMNRVDRRVIKALQSSGNIQVIRSPGGLHHIFGMDVRQKSLDDNNIRLALKYGIDRQLLLDTALQGSGRLGNDHPIPNQNRYFNSALSQRQFDPDKAKFHLKEAGLTTFKIPLHASVGAYPEAVDQAILYADSAKKAGLEIEIVREPADGFWTNVYMKKPFVTSYASGEVTAELSLFRRFHSQSQLNLCRWNNPEFDKQILAVREEANEENRKDILWKLQEMVSNESGLLVPVFADFMDAAHKKIKNAVPNPVRELDDNRIAERSWFVA